MERRPVWLDCDPGHDDMLAIIMAALSDSLDLFMVSTSAGNSTIQNTTTNALNILHAIGRRDIPVIQGVDRPLCKELVTAPHIHGATGLEGAVLEPSPCLPIVGDPIFEVFTRLKSKGRKVSCVVTGALTNLALLLRCFPSVVECIESITIMGGAIGQGNITGAAEFNILVDPEAAAIVFGCGMRVVMVPLEVTHTVLVDDAVFKALQDMPSAFCQQVYSLMRFFQVQYKLNQDFDFPVAHDPCTIFYLLHPEHFVTKQGKVDIELEGKSRGRTNCKLFNAPSVNALVCVKVNVPEFWKVMLACLSKIQ